MLQPRLCSSVSLLLCPIPHLLSPLYTHKPPLHPSSHWLVATPQLLGKEEGCHPQPSSSPQKPQPSPGAQSSCSSDHSPAGSAANTDSGVEMTGNTGGSTEDLSSLDEGPCIAGAGLSTLRRLENLRLDQLHQLRPMGPRGLKLPSLTHTGETWVAGLRSGGRTSPFRASIEKLCTRTRSPVLKTLSSIHQKTVAIDTIWEVNAIP